MFEFRVKGLGLGVRVRVTVRFKGALQLQLTAMVKFAWLRYLSESRLRVLSF